MTSDERDQGARKQIDAALAQLVAPVQAAGLAMPADQLIDTCVSGENEARESSLRGLHIELLSTLGAADARLGKAYGLGQALSDTTRSPRDAPSLRKRFKPSRVARLRTELDDLATAFPAHAANAVNKTLCRWSEELWPPPAAAAPPSAARLPHIHLHRGASDATPPLPDEDLLTYARRQGQMWRALLSGEKCGEDMLRPPDYVKAAGQTLSQTRTLAWQVVRRFPIMTALAVLLFVGGLILMIGMNGSGSVVAGAITVLASVGITWKGIGAAAGGVAARVEQHLWGAELDSAISDATFILDRDNKTSAERRRLARQAAQGNKEAQKEAPVANAARETTVDLTPAGHL